LPPGMFTGASSFGICERKNRNRSLPQVGGLGHETRALSIRPTGLLDHGQWFFSSRGILDTYGFANWYPNAIQIHTPVHASWLNQVEISSPFSNEKSSHPTTSPDLIALQMAMFEFEDLYNEIAKPFEWKYTKDDLKKTLEKIEAKEASNPQRFCKGSVKAPEADMNPRPDLRQGALSRV
jgi:hypothetical protein